MAHTSLFAPLLCVCFFITTTNALGVAKKAAIGIGVGLGFCLIAAVIGFIVLLTYKKKRRSSPHGEVMEVDVPKPTKQQIYAAHGKDMAQGFDIWGGNQPTVEAIRAKKAAERAAAGRAAV